ncbi:hypothetical protein A9Q99_02195 [Gammaproteobacteria bacterium 45_16_T64]|nr:hypothetical protein A9Q99_02195 [Gammaproteobacteria bacterium 45_16_T64]
MKTVHKDESHSHPDWLEGGYYEVNEYVKNCSSCGWWKLRCNKVTTGSIDARSVEITNAILRRYDLSSKNIPIITLQNYLRNNFEDVIHIHHNRMEKLVQSVFREHFSCDVEHIGKSHDGGIDLILINSDNPTIVQVKRRKKLLYTEGIAGIREFIGAAKINGNRNCIYVSTCSKFSNAAIEGAKEVVKNDELESYELYDFDRFCSALKLTTVKEKKPWKYCLRNGW